MAQLLPNGSAFHNHIKATTVHQITFGLDFRYRAILRLAGKKFQENIQRRMIKSCSNNYDFLHFYRSFSQSAHSHLSSTKLKFRDTNGDKNDPYESGFNFFLSSVFSFDLINYKVLETDYTRHALIFSCQEFWNFNIRK